MAEDRNWSDKEWKLHPLGWDGERVRMMEDVDDENAG